MMRRRIISAAYIVAIVVPILGPHAVAQSGQGCPSDPGCKVEASLENDYLLGHSGPDSELTFEVFDSPGGDSLYGPETYATDAAGLARADLAWPADIDLVPGMVVEMRDTATGTTKQLQLASLSMDVVDPDTDVVTGVAPAGGTVSITGAANAQTTADSDGAWTVNFAALGYDVRDDDVFAVELFDDDGDGTIDEAGVSLTEVPGGCAEPDPENCPPGTSPPPCTETSTRICGTTGPDTIRFSNGEALSGAAEDTLILRVGAGTDDSTLDPGTSGNTFVVDLSEDARRAWHRGGTAPIVLMDGRTSSTLFGFLPPRPGELTVKMLGSPGMDLVSSFFFPLPGDKSVSPGRYRLRGRGGDDVMDAGDGHDLLDGGTGDDFLEGKNGKDVLVGGRGTDWLDGGRGYDVCYATAKDTTFGCERIVKRRSF